MFKRTDKMYNPGNLCDDFSPTLPHDFPKDMIPSFIFKFR